MQHTINKPEETHVREAGDTLTLKLVFKLADGKGIDDTRKNKAPPKVPVGTPMKPKGLEQGLKGMKNGEQRTVVVPHELCLNRRHRFPDQRYTFHRI